MRFVVELEPGVWLTTGEGDPPRTTDAHHAEGYPTLRLAVHALEQARTYRPFRRAVIH